MKQNSVNNEPSISVLVSEITSLKAKLEKIEFLQDSELLSKLTKTSGIPFGTEGFFNNDPGRSYTTVFDGDTFSYFDSTTQNGAMVGLDFGSLKTVRLIRYHPRRQNEIRVLGGKLEYSIDGINYILFETIKSVIVGWNEFRTYEGLLARYVRYTSPFNGYGNISEIEIYCS